MHSLSRRSVAILATAATLGAGSLTTASQALGAASLATSGSGKSSGTSRGAIDAAVQVVLDALTGSTVPLVVQSLTLVLNAGQVATLLDAASPAQLNALLAPGALPTSKLNGAVDSLLGSGDLDRMLLTMTGAATGDLLVAVSDDTLTDTLAVLTTTQLTAALATLLPAELASVVDGLSPLRTGELLGAVSTGDTAQLTATLAALTNTQLVDGLGALDLVQLGDLLAPLSGSPLHTILGALLSNKINGAIGTLSSGELTTLLGAMSTPEVAGVLGTAGLVQLTGVLAAVPSSQLGSALALLNPSQATAIVGALTPAELSGLLGVVSGTQLASVLGATSPPQLGGALGLLSGSQLTSVLGVLTAPQLGGALALLNVVALSPGQITSLIGAPGGTQTIVTGLSSRATSISGAVSADAVNSLLPQVQALLGGGLPTVPGTEGLLNTVKSLVGVAGVDTSVLTGLLATASAALGASVLSPAATALQGLIRAIGGVLASAGLFPDGTPAPAPGTTPRPAPLATQPASTVERPGFGAYRASIGAVRVAKNRRSAKISITCPAMAPKGCLVTLNGTVAGKRFAVKPFVLMRTLNRTVTVRFSQAVATRLKQEGGALKVSSLTSFSSLAAATKTVKVARSVKR
ncbi:MAG TPA: hypothetical protein VGO80_02670 [Solirubrobacteraceae bacterium]|jgi:hypothetical protein|nr:hypothetical protein [Solirubrobacteraceae bacterium]